MGLDDETSEPLEGDARDKFYHGTVEKLYQGGERGVIKAASGREIPFTFAHVAMIGPLRRFEDLREGLEVGFDVSWTSNGLRVSAIRVFD